ncbi:polysaccharide deacetylase family protein [Streptomyces sp. MST-110588]|uniref:polysaccharide deacetylase family protein n=1 Tax=Streptomyces sp. MST-110588 TaxID=2833628 RepID=UPI001F5CF106|nr:polysaccharide deacetylase family protein [Streptomyces sp. MST-110588]
MVRHIAEQFGDDVVVMVDSTNGLLDGTLRAAGLRVFRLDPWDLPPRSAQGFSEALEMARRGLSGGDGLVETNDDSGTLTGRLDELRAGIAASADVAAELAGRGKFLERGPGVRRQVALTFDDGPTPPYTHRVLDILREYRVPATFFCVGLHAHTDPDSIVRIAEAGHGIGNHTWSHPFLPDLRRDEVLFQLESTNKAIEKVTGAPVEFLRPPYGSRTPESLTWLADQGMTTVLWDRDSCDWAMPGVDSIVDNALDGITNGSVVLMHDGGGDRSQTVAALPRIIEALIEDDYELVTVDRLTAADRPAADG